MFSDYVDKAQLEAITELLSKVELQPLPSITIETEERPHPFVIGQLLPPRCNLAKIPCQMNITHLLRRLFEMSSAAAQHVTSSSQTLQDHALWALIIYIFDKLAHDGYAVPQSITAIAIEHARSDPSLVLATWKYADMTDQITPKTLDETSDDAHIGAMTIMFGMLEPLARPEAAYEKLLQTPLCELPSDITNNITEYARLLERAMTTVNGRLYSMLCEDDGVHTANAAAILIVFALRHLGRMGYPETSSIKALALTDACALMGHSGDSAEAAWWAALTQYPEDHLPEVRGAWEEAKMTGTVGDMSAMSM